MPTFGAIASTIVGATLLCSLGQRCTYVNSTHSTNVTPTISQRCPNHQPTLPQPSANIVPNIRQRYPNHQPSLPKPSANVTPTTFQCVPNLQKTNIFIIKYSFYFKYVSQCKITINFHLSIVERTKILCNIIMYTYIM